jgi:hypothetical protein
VFDELFGLKMGSSSVGIARQDHPAPWSNNRIDVVGVHIGLRCSVRSPPD